MTAYSARYDHALAFAAHAHRHQLRKGSNVPYIVHVVHVSAILLRHGYDEDIVIAGVLHDVVEDTNTTIAELEVLFGVRVAQLVDAVSEQKQDAGVERLWEDRKQDNIARLEQGTADVAALKAADAIHNARALIADLHAKGAAAWAPFKRGAAPTLWYYGAIETAVRAKLADAPIAAELRATLAELNHTVQEYA